MSRLEKLINIGLKKVEMRGNFLSLRDARNDINIGFRFAVHAADCAAGSRVGCVL